MHEHQVFQGVTFLLEKLNQVLKVYCLVFRAACVSWTLLFVTGVCS